MFHNSPMHALASNCISFSTVLPRHYEESIDESLLGLCCEILINRSQMTGVEAVIRCVV